MFNEFKKFIMKGNVLDLAIAFIIGAAFKAIITSFVNDILMPPIGILIGGVNFKELAFVLQKATETAPAVTLKYGSFIQTVIDFLIIAASVFVVVKAYQRMQKKKEEAPAPPPAPSSEVALLSEIRDLLKKQSDNEGPSSE
ncbi:MAG: large-conductance mechanosensitive channel protein MscL [Cyclobacteriaceae bacterium]